MSDNSINVKVKQNKANCEDNLNEDQASNLKEIDEYNYKSIKRPLCFDVDEIEQDNSDSNDEIDYNYDELINSSINVGINDEIDYIYDERINSRFNIGINDDPSIEGWIDFGTKFDERNTIKKIEKNINDNILEGKDSKVTIEINVKYLKELRKKLRLKLREASENMDITYAYLNKIENNISKNISIFIAEEICSGYNKILEKKNAENYRIFSDVIKVYLNDIISINYNDLDCDDAYVIDKFFHYYFRDKWNLNYHAYLIEKSKLQNKSFIVPFKLNSNSVDINIKNLRDEIIDSSELIKVTNIEQRRLLAEIVYETILVLFQENEISVENYYELNKMLEELRKKLKI